MTTSRRIRANRRRWSRPVPVIRYSEGRLSAEMAEHLKARFEAAVRLRQPILVGSEFEVIR